MPGYEFANWELGYGDFHLVPDLSTLRHQLAGAHRPECSASVVDDNEPQRQKARAPRSILYTNWNRQGDGLRMLCRLRTGMLSFEDTYRQAFEQHYQNLKPTGWYLGRITIFCRARNRAVHRRRPLAPQTFRRAGREPGIGEGLGNTSSTIRYAEALDAVTGMSFSNNALGEIADDMKRSPSWCSMPPGGLNCHIHMASGTTSSTSLPAATIWYGGFHIFPVVPRRMDTTCPTSCPLRAHRPIPTSAVDASWRPPAWYGATTATAGFRVVGKVPSLRIECRIPGRLQPLPGIYAAALVSRYLDGIRADRTAGMFFREMSTINTFLAYLSRLRRR